MKEVALQTQGYMSVLLTRKALVRTVIMAFIAGVLKLSSPANLGRKVV